MPTAMIQNLLEWEVLDQTFGIRLGDTFLAVSWMNAYADLDIDELFDVVTGQLIRGGLAPRTWGGSCLGMYAGR